MNYPPWWRVRRAHRIALANVYWSLRRGGLKYSEWAVKTPEDRRLRVGWDPRFESHRPAAHEVEP